MRYLKTRSMSLSLALGALACLSSPAFAQHEDFDSYEAGKTVVGKGGWEEWGAGAGALVSTTQALSLKNSVDITGKSDLVHQYYGHTHGKWVYTAWQYIPKGLDKKSYFILLSSYGATNKWAVQVGADPVTGKVKADTAGGGAETPIVYDKWVKLQAFIHLDMDWVQFYYDGNLMDPTGLADHPILGGGWKWTDGPGNHKGVLNIGAVDLFANGSTTSVFYDEISLMPYPSWADDFDSYADKSQVVGQGGWEEWGAGAGAFVSTVQKRGLGNSIDITLKTDLVHQYKGYTSGRWQYTAWQYIPTGLDKKSYFIMMSSYGTTNKWAVQVGADPVTGKVKADSAGGGSETPIVYDKWVLLRVVIDLDEDWVQFYYDGKLMDPAGLADHPILGGGYKWTDGPGNQKGFLNIAAVDLFANGSTKSVFYDDMKLVPLAAPQAGVGVVRAPAPSKILTLGTTGQVPATGITQVSFQPYPGKPGMYLCCLTVNGLDSKYGSGAALLGTYAAAAGKFTPTDYAKNISTNTGDFGLMVDATGLLAVMDKSDGPYFASRTKLDEAFSTATKLTDITAKWVDPALGYVGGTLMLFWVDANMIAMQPFNKTTAKLTGTKLYVAKSAKVGGSVNSPTPIAGKDGDVEGLFLADLKGSDNDMVFAEDLDAETPVQMLVDTSGWDNNGGVAGALFAWSNGTGGRHADDLVGAWLLGDAEKLGGTLDITGAAPTDGGKTTMFDVVMVSTKTRHARPIPGFLGNFGLDLGTGFVFAATTHKGADDLWSISLGVPNAPGLHGLTLPMQAISFDQALKTIVLSNTAYLRIQ